MKIYFKLKIHFESDLNYMITVPQVWKKRSHWGKQPPVSCCSARSGYLHSKAIIVPLSVPFSSLLTVEAGTCVWADMAHIVTRRQKQKKMFRCGLDGNQQCLRRPSSASCHHLPRGICRQSVLHPPVCRNVTVQNMGAATSIGEYFTWQYILMHSFQALRS